MTTEQRLRFGEALGGQRAALTTELGLSLYTTRLKPNNGVRILRVRLKRISESEDKVVRVVGGMGDSFVSGATQFSSKTARIKELEHELAQLPDVRGERLRTQIQAIDTQSAALGVTQAPITTGLRVALPTPMVWVFKLPLNLLSLNNFNHYLIELLLNG